MAKPPETLTVEEHLEGSHRGEQLARWTFLGLVAALAFLALLNLVGQRPHRSVAQAAAASLTVVAPTRIRGGLYFEGRFTIEARRTLKRPTLVLDEGWTEGLQINTIVPGPVSETSRNGVLALEFDRLDPATRLVVWMQFQVNPTTVQRRSQDVQLLDGEAPLASVDRTVTVLP